MTLPLPLPKEGNNTLRGQAPLGSFANGETAFFLYNFVWEEEPRDSWVSVCNVLNFALTPRPRPAWAAFDEAGRSRHELGPVMFIPTGLKVHSGGGTGWQRSLIGLFSDQAFERLLDKPLGWGGWSEDVLERALNINSPWIQQILVRICRELKQPGFASGTLLSSLADALAIELVRLLHADRPAAPQARSGGLAPWRMRRIDERVHADGPAPDLAELAAICQISVRQLSRAFKAETGLTIAGYVQQAVLERAQGLLTQSDVPIAEIALRLGFANSTSFCNAYRRHTGQRPSEVRRLWGRREQFFLTI